jgi:hypothetical protein
MTYGYQPDNWPAFESELRRHGVEVTDIERVEFRPAGDAPAGTFDVTVTLRSGRVEVIKPRQADDDD